MSDLPDIEKPEIDDIDVDIRAAMGEIGHEPTPETRIEIDKVDSRGREERGKFVEAPKEEKTKVPAVVAVPEVAVTEAVGVQSVAKAPPGWTPAMRDEFGKLPPHLQT